MGSLKTNQYALFQGISRFTLKHNDIREQMKGLIDKTYATEEEMLEVVRENICEGTFFEFSYNGLGVETSYTFDISCDDFLEDGSVNIEKLIAKYYELRDFFSNA